MMMEKQIIRDRIRGIKQDITETKKREASERVKCLIESLKEFQNSKNILLYYALPDELSTECMLNEWRNRKNIFLPVVKGNNLVVKKYNPDLMEVGAFNIKEPVGKEVDIDIIDFIIVPGVAFDKECNRLGRGKGFYDKLLSNSNAYFVGIGYDCQIVEKIPAMPHDIKMNCIITETNIL